jgi:predicted ATPase/DNA-binding CsgD family transcriptional regulator
MKTKRPPDALTDRERQILRYICQHLSNQEIADQLHLSLKTVKWYNTQIFTKLGVANRLEAIRALAQPDIRVAYAAPLALPPQTGPFVGRSAELQHLTTVLREPDTRIVTLAGPGGIGKTRLAIEIARQNAASFRDGAVFVALAGVESVAGLLAAIGDTLGVQFAYPGDPVAQLHGYVRHQEMLLILDNVEHLLDGALQVAELAAAAPRVRVLLTSRERLGLAGEHVVQLGGLSLPGEDGDMLESDAVRLFLEHARRARHDFVPDQAALARIAHLTGGMPLALVLAAAWADILPAAQIAEEISRSVDTLQHEARDLPPRHRSIRALFDPTWNRLTRAQQDVLMRMSCFPASFTREAARHVAGADLPMLGRLAAKSLIQVQSNGRFTLHPLLRQYCAVQLQRSDKAAGTQATHAHFYLERLARSAGDIVGRRQETALADLRNDVEHIHQAWTWAVTTTQAEPVDVIERALDALAIAGELTGRIAETAALLRAALDRFQSSHQRLSDRIAVRLARLTIALGEPIDSGVIHAALQCAREQGDERQQSWCLWVLSQQDFMVRGHDSQAKDYLEKMIAVCRRRGDTYLLARGLTDVAWRYANGGQVRQAVDVLRESIVIRRHTGNLADLGFVTVQLSWMLLDFLRDVAGAEDLLDEQIALQHTLANQAILPLLLGFKALIAFWRSDTENALCFAQQGCDLAHGQNYMSGMSVCRAIISMLACARADYSAARELCRNSTSTFVNVSAFPANWALALAAYGLGHVSSFKAYMASALQIACRFQSPLLQGMSLALVAVMLRAEQPERAVAYIILARAPFVQLGAWLDNWPLFDRACAELQEHLGVAAYAQVIERAATLDLDSEAARVLAELR